MSSKPAIPALVIVPGDTHMDYQALYSIASAYAHSGLIISSHGEKSNQMAFTFPAIVCSSFAIELFMKFFLMIGKLDKADIPQKHDSGHKLSGLWNKINTENQNLIAGMFQNNTDLPHLNAIELRKEQFLKALEHIGDTPFVQWRYVYEIPEMTLMSHASVTEVLDALGYAAKYVVKQKSIAANNS